MITIYEDTNPRELTELISEVDSGSSVLPEFQRDFVWDPGAIASLINSIIKLYPAGSILRIRNTKNLFQWRHFHGADNPTAASPVFLVLDGQQRLTSLHSALYGTGTYRFFLDVRGLMDGEEIEECLSWEKATSKKAKRLNDKAAQIAELILPIAEFVSGDLSDWVNAAAVTDETKKDGPALLARQKKISDVLNPISKAIKGYKFPVVTLSDSTEAEAVCTIFETLNKTGVRLSVFELLTARFFPQGVNLRRLWDEAQDSYPILTQYGVDPYYLLQTISALETNPLSIRRGNVLNLSAPQIEKHWDKACFAMAEGLELLKNRCGVLSQKWLPYAPSLITIASAIYQRPITKGTSSAEYKRKLCRWFWGASLGQHYERASNTRVEKDIPALLRWLDGGEPPDTTKAFITQEQILSTTQRQRALYRAIMCAIISSRPLDFHNGTVIDSALLQTAGIDDHHIFPLAALGVTDRRRPPVEFDNIANRTLIDAATNKSINADPPSKYLARISDSQSIETWERTLRSHLIDEEAVSAMQGDDFETFRDRRVQAIERRLIEVLT